VLSVADIFRSHAAAYLARFGARVPPSHRRAIADIVACRTEAMGGVLLACDDCGRHRTVLHSCRNRACPQCHAQQTVRWVAARAAELLPVTFHHVIFTVPWQLRQVARRHQRAVLGALMRAAAESLQTLAGDPRFGGGRLAVLAVLHTWSATLLWHPHVHCLVPGLVVRADRTWRRTHRGFLVPVGALSRIVAAKFARLVRRELPDVRLPEALFDRPWNVYTRPCFEGPANVLRYLAQYVFRGPMDNRRILGIDHGRYVLQYRDNDTRRLDTVRLEPHEFMRRYLQHTLPRGLHRVRYFGWWGPSCRPTLRGLQLQLGSGLAELTETLAVQARQQQAAAAAACCPYCGSNRSHFVGRRLRDRPPPSCSRDPP